MLGRNIDPEILAECLPGLEQIPNGKMIIYSANVLFRKFRGQAFE